MNILIAGVGVLIVVVVSLAMRAGYKNYAKEINRNFPNRISYEQIMPKKQSRVVEFPQNESEEMPDSFRGISTTTASTLSAGISATGPTPRIIIPPYIAEKASIHDVEPGHYIFGEEVEEDKQG